mmetsp:Transcript_84670/g.202961  ORF Transcript_84670/g.202961 Transcript_84670/m.202961 type:complete len:694 (-) Transcript_84670:120-2201(-)
MPPPPRDLSRGRPMKEKEKREMLVCTGCGQRRSKMPSSWTLDDCLFYCPACWQETSCGLCGHHDPKGSNFKGAWNCRACRHKRIVKEKHAPDHDVLQQLIISESSALCQPECAAHPAPPATLWDAEADVKNWSDDENAEDDVVCDLPVKLQPKVHVPDARHIVLLLDASGSMRNQDVDADPEIQKELGNSCPQLTRLEAAELCAMKFAKEHEVARPQDIFSVVTFHETASIIARQLSAAEVAKGLALSDRPANGTFYLEGLKAAVGLLSEKRWPGTVVLLSDGRPADTKAALAYLQEHFLGQEIQLHGIGFGSRVESFAALQQLACLTGGTFALSGCTVRGLCRAFSSVSSTITAGPGGRPELASQKPRVREVTYELPEVGVFGKKHVVHFSAARSIFSYDGETFQLQTFRPGPVVRRRLPYMRGGMRLVYGFQDEQVCKNGSWMVAKCSRYQDDVLNSRAVVEAHAKSTAIAHYFASRFNAKLHSLGEMAKLLFVPCFVYHSEGPAVDEFFAAERYLPGVFLKYNSNNGYAAYGSLPHNDLVQAFLHFSFQESGGHIIVADLQGVARESEVLLTDPQVLSLNRAYGPGDLGAAGYLRCLGAHRCGPTCKKLGLSPISSATLRRIHREGEAAGGMAKTLLAAMQANSGSSAGWQKVSSFGSDDWAKISDLAAAEYASEGNASSHVSASSWTHL